MREYFIIVKKQHRVFGNWTIDFVTAKATGREEIISRFASEKGEEYIYTLQIMEVLDAQEFTIDSDELTEGE